MTVFPSDPQLATSLQATTDNVKDAIPECAGLSISLVRDDVETLTFVRTNTLTGVLDAVQYLDDGPCETTVRSGQEVRIEDVLTDENWPLFARISAAGGIRSTLSLPLRRGPKVVGSVNAYGDVPHAFTGREEEIADSFGVHIQSMISNADLSESPRPNAEADAADSQADRAVIDEALAVLVERGFDSQTVERRLAQAATRARVSLLDVARGIVLSMRGSDERERAADRRDRDADTREAALDEREAQGDVREATNKRRSEAIQDIIDEADLRDLQADARDYIAHRRDMDATLDEYLDQETDTKARQARGASAQDRRDSRADRTASKGDRTYLADEATDHADNRPDGFDQGGD